MVANSGICIKCGDPISLEENAALLYEDGTFVCMWCEPEYGKTRDEGLEWAKWKISDTFFMQVNEEDGLRYLSCIHTGHSSRSEIALIFPRGHWVCADCERDFIREHSLDIKEAAAARCAAARFRPLATDAALQAEIEFEALEEEIAEEEERRAHWAEVARARDEKKRNRWWKKGPFS